MVALMPIAGGSIPPFSVTVTLPRPVVEARMPAAPVLAMSPLEVTATVPVLDAFVILASMPSPAAKTAVEVTLILPAAPVELALMPMPPTGVAALVPICPPVMLTVIPPVRTKSH